MFSIKLFCVILSLLVDDAECRKSFNINEVRLKNGAVIINVDANWGSQTQVMSVFIKNGAALKFDRKTSFPSLAFKMLDYRLQRLAKLKGFIVKSEFTWDYSAFTFYLPKMFIEEQSTDLWDTIFNRPDIDSIELDNLKMDVLALLKEDLNRRFSRLPMISLMSQNSSVYSLGLYGSEDDLKSVSEKELSEFLKCYMNPLGAVISVSGISKKGMQSMTRELEKNKPCFRDERFFNETINAFNVPIRKINYAKADGVNSILRMGFPSVGCTQNTSFAYDLVQQLVYDDTGFSNISKSIYVSNNCSVGGGVTEIIFSDLKDTDMEDTIDTIFKRFSTLGKNIGDGSLSLAKQHIIERYSKMLGKRDSIIFLAGKMRALYGDHGSMLNYIDKINAVPLHEVRKIMTGVTEQNSYCVMIRLEG